MHIIYKDKQGELMKAGIAVDQHKVPIFTRRLKAAGYAFKNKGLLSRGIMLLEVTTDNAEALQEIVRAANEECAGRGTKQ